MFHCDKCYKLTSPREPMFKQPTYRGDGSILKESSLCVKCATGKPFEDKREKETYQGFNRLTTSEKLDRKQEASYGMDV